MLERRTSEVQCTRLIENILVMNIKIEMNNYWGNYIYIYNFITLPVVEASNIIKSIIII